MLAQRRTRGACHGAVGRPGRDGCPPLVEQDVGRLRADLIFRQLLHVAVVEAVPETVHRVLTIGCVVPPLHGAVMVAHRIQVIHVVLWVPPESVRPSPRRPVRGQAPAALASLNHVGRHVQAGQGELDHVLEFHAPVSVLPEALQVDDEHVGQRPQAQRDAPLLQLLAVRAAPGVVGGEPLLFGVELETLGQRAGLRLLVARLLQAHAFRIWDVLVLSADKQEIFRLLVPFHH